ncbi:MAG: hypothetical protein QW589_01305 [Candidatus Bathyarchaeia archaeon]
MNYYVVALQDEGELINLIPTTWIRQYYFCPRIIYYLGVLGYNERLTEHE